MSLNVPVSVSVAGVVLLVASNLDLLEAPLRKVDVSSAEVAAQCSVLKAEGGRESADSAAIAGCRISDDLNAPVVLVITNSEVTIAGHFAVRLGDGGIDLVRVQVAASLGVNETNDGSITNESEVGGLGVVIGFEAVGVKEPVVVGILVVVASNLLLARALGIGLNVRVKKTTAIAHILDGSTRSDGNLQGAVLADFGSLQVGLEQGAHLGITRAGGVEDGKVQSKGDHVDEERNNDETHDASREVGGKDRLQKCKPTGIRTGITGVYLQ